MPLESLLDLKTSEIPGKTEKEVAFSFGECQRGQGHTEDRRRDQNRGTGSRRNIRE